MNESHKKNSVLVISHHFYPDPAVGAKRMSELTLYLRQQNYQLTVIAARQKTAGPIEQRLVRKVQHLSVTYLPTMPKFVDWIWRAFQVKKNDAKTAAPIDSYSNSNEIESIINRMRRYILSWQTMFGRNKFWCILACLKLLVLRLSRPVDILISSGPPKSAHLPSLFAKKLFDANWIVDLRDPWISNRGTRRNSHSAFKTWAETESGKVCLHRCDLIVCAAPGVKRRLIALHPWTEKKTVIIRNGFDDGIMLTKSAPKQSGKLILLFAGTLYLERDPFPLLRAIRRIIEEKGIDRSRLEVRLIGNCLEWDGVDLKIWIAEQKIDDIVSVCPPMDSMDIAREMANASVLINFSQGQVDQIPAKTYDYVGAEREFIAITELNSDTAVLVNGDGVARVVSPDDEQGMIDVLVDLYRFYVTEKKTFRVSDSLREKYSRQQRNFEYLQAIENLSKK